MDRSVRAGSYRDGNREAARAAASGTPLACLDLDALEHNAGLVLDLSGQKPIRLATKSLRCVQAVKHLLALHPCFQGVMCYHPREAAALLEAGISDVLMGYPTLDRPALARLAGLRRQGKEIVLMADDDSQLRAAEQAAREQQICFDICLDIDMSSAFGGLHFGVRRSPLRSEASVLELADAIRRSPHLQLSGVMGYEAQLAGFPDAKPGQKLMSAAIRYLKRRSEAEVAARRAAIVRVLRREGHELRFVNGGGSGSLRFTASDESVTELTAGSAFYAPALFDGYADLPLQPAAVFALPVVRVAAPGIYTCFGGGYPASGEAGADRLPQPFWPPGGQLLPREGAGEVQTPVRYPEGAEPLRPGDLIWFRHAKAGELAERFREFIAVKQGACLGTWATYRGEGWCFG
ncbi:alanine racemase [Paenibacillus thiaminolyticus]|uniref:Alanine racemase n=2 Tax=Paenibacillus thiaminolyticus TaxID=49283 RepID=A0AAP9E0V4_PANTH|nr:alanine racemase [Paenibacillus thiaminolyticus]MCY9535367.1 alanine racemase [Paenibacillus thiaminolyticus]MCY9603356.1 alanine racemase [Paenibacillus thiaminolyticus]MCY9607401.1 alanine racemase [Paenibacillus thiaminolyticus]MCY9616459.1 alanine racemase [Paenibacillus thiaminolyticus]MCY9621257.1 alanine racemase [Paenibacillus thiaminolyticus]